MRIDRVLNVFLPIKLAENDRNRAANVWGRLLCESTRAGEKRRLPATQHGEDFWRKTREFGSFYRVSSLQIEDRPESILKLLLRDTSTSVSMGKTCFSLGRRLEIVDSHLDFVVFLTDGLVSIRRKRFVTSHCFFRRSSMNESLIILSSHSISSAIQILNIIQTAVIKQRSMILRHWMMTRSRIQSNKIPVCPILFQSLRTPSTTKKKTNHSYHVKDWIRSRHSQVETAAINPTTVPMNPNVKLKRD